MNSFYWKYLVTVVLLTWSIQEGLSLQSRQFVARTVRDVVKEQRNKEIVLDFYQRLFGDHDLSAIDQFVSPDYIQHATDIADGREAFRKYMAANLPPPGSPKTPRYIERSAAEGDNVWLHTKATLGTTTDAAIGEIYRLKDNLIVEHFSIIQPIPSISANPQPMFNILAKEFQPHCQFGRDTSQIVKGLSRRDENFLKTVN